MSVCETCWTEASLRAAIGKDGILSVAEHYARLIEEPQHDRDEGPGLRATY